MAATAVAGDGIASWSLQGATSTSVIMDGPADKIEQGVRMRLWELGRTGGYFCALDQGMPFPRAHVEAFRRALELHGQYPLSKA